MFAHNQYRFSAKTQIQAHVGSRGKIDLALIDRVSATFIGVEYKVRDCEKPGRLQNYRLLIDAEGLQNKWLFEIVQQREHDIDGMEYVDGIRTWDELVTFFGANASLLPSSGDRQWVDHYLEFLRRSGTVLGRDSVKRMRRSNTGPPPETLKTMLTAIRRELPDTVGGIRVENNLPVHLRLGRDSWSKKFPGNWHERIWMYLRQTPGSADVYPIFSIIFYHAAYTSFDYAESHLPLWAERAASAGLLLWRGPEKGWDGKKRIELKPPWTLGCKPKYFYAEERENVVVARSFKLHTNTRELIEYAVAGFNRYADLVESFKTR